MGLFFKRKKKELYEEHTWSDSSNYSRDETLDEQKIMEELENPKEESEFSSLNDKEEKLMFVEDCCDQILESAKRMADAKKECQVVNGYLDDIRKIREQETSKRDELFQTARRIRNLKLDKENYKTYATKIPESKYYYIQNHEKELPTILKDLSDDEENEQTLKTNLHLLEGEKSALVYERKQADRHISTLRNIALLLLLLAVVILCGMFYFHLNSDYDFTIGIFLTIAIAAAAMAGIVMGYQREVREIRLTERRLDKAITLSNKYKLLYVNVKSRVDYLYKTLEIHNAYELNNYWRLYLTAKKEQEAYAKMSDELYREQKHFKELIAALNLYDASVWDYQIEALVDESVMQELVDNLEKRKKGLLKNIEFNRKRSDKCKTKIKRITEEEPELAKDVLKIVEEKGNEI
jgi:hypothetical protein